jgi:hypothetical protein
MGLHRDKNRGEMIANKHSYPRFSLYTRRLSNCLFVGCTRLLP